MNSKCALSIMLLVILNSIAFAQEDGDPISIGHYRKITSEILGEDRLLQICLPQNYESNSDKKYPVLYRLDGEFILNNTVTSVEQVVTLEEAPGVPEMIIVGIPNHGESRGRDMFPPVSQYAPDDADPSQFLQFIKTELIPFISSNYRTNETRILAGQSNSGFYAWWVLLQEPKLFKGIIAISPSFADFRDYMINEVNTHARDEALNGAYLYMARGGQGREEGVAESLAILLPLLEPASGLTIKTKVYEDLGHVPFPALYDALKTMGTDLFLPQPRGGN